MTIHQQQLHSFSGLSQTPKGDPETKKILSRVLALLLQKEAQMSDMEAMDDAYEEDANSSLPETEAVI